MVNEKKHPKRVLRKKVKLKQNPKYDRRKKEEPLERGRGICDFGLVSPHHKKPLKSCSNTPPRSLDADDAHADTDDNEEKHRRRVKKNYSERL